MARNREGIKSKQELVYEEYINTNKSVTELAEEFGVKYGTCVNMLHRERSKRGIVNKKRH